jgi:hypothetical protein
MKNFLKAILIPLCVVIINSMVFTVWGGPTIIRNIIRMVAVFAGGWLIVKKDAGSPLHAALAGPFLIFVDHVLLMGGYVLLFHFIDPARFGYQGLMTFGGIIVSYVMLFWIPLLIAFIGGIVAKHT